MSISISSHWHTIQGSLFPNLKEELGYLSEKQHQLVTVIEMSRIGEYIDNRYGRVGRPMKNRHGIANAYVAKAVYSIPTTRMLIDRLKSDCVLRRICGFERLCDIPSESTFSRAMAEFSETELSKQVHEDFINRYHAERLIGHISRDASKIESREKAIKKPIMTKASRKRGRPKKGELVAEKPQKRLERQRKQGLNEMIAELPTECDMGCKSTSKGYAHTWIGYKLHADVSDGGVAISVLLSSASLHDSQAAIPLATMTSQRVTNLYDLMDAAYDCPAIRDHSRSLGHVDIIDHNKRRGTKIKFAPAEAVRYRERSTSERYFGRLKDDLGARFVRVRGHKKVLTHLMFAVIALNVQQTLRMIC